MSEVVNLLVVDDDPSITRFFEELAGERGWSVRTTSTGEDALKIISGSAVEVALVDIKLPGYNGMQILEYAKKNNIRTEIIIITGVGTAEIAMEAIGKGAYDYIAKPFEDIDKLAICIERAMDRYRLTNRVRVLEGMPPGRYEYEGIVGKSQKMQEIFEMIESVAPTSSTVLITGESGTGKELVAKAIHNKSQRKDKPFVAVNCSAIPETLLESELFGHKKGSFTGALSDKRGLFEEADGGTLFLDEVGEIQPKIQVKLLRALEEGEIRPVGGTENKRVDVRVIAATNRDLKEEVELKRFREDLYYRLNVVVISLPPLRARNEDIPLLAYHFLSKVSEKIGKHVDRISVDALQALQRYSWRGNIRELENVIERAVVLSSSNTIQTTDLPPHVLGESFYIVEEFGDAALSRYPYQEAKERAIASFNYSYITNLLRQTNGNLSLAAEKAGMDRSNFRKVLKKYGIKADDFRMRKHAGR